MIPVKRLRPSSVGTANLHLRGMAGKPVPVAGARQRPIYSGGAYLQRPGARDNIFNIQDSADLMADRLAVLDGDLRAVGTVRHDLHGWPFAAEHAHPRTRSKPIAAMRGMMISARRASKPVWCGVFSSFKTKKAACWATPVNISMK